MKTKLGKEVPRNTRSVLYLCDYNNDRNSIEVKRELFYSDEFSGLEAYSNIHNPESQLASGGSFEELCKDLEKLHERMADPSWLLMLSESL